MSNIYDNFTINVRNGVQFNGVIWKAKSPKANLVIGTGMCEHATRYEPFALFLIEHGFNVYGLDFLGQGNNVGKPDDQMKCPPDSFNINVEALHEAIVYAKAENQLPTSVLAHSMGSFILQSLLERFPESADKVILVGTNGGQATLMKFGSLVAKMLTSKKNWNKNNKFIENLAMGGYAKSVKNRESNFDWVSYDKSNREKYLADPYCGAKTTTGFWHGFLGGLAKIWDKKSMQSISKNEKILIIAGEDDCVGRNGKGPRWLSAKYKKLGIKDTTLILYPHMRHEILNEAERQNVYDDVLCFLEK